MKELDNRHYKEKMPEETIKELENILSSLDIEVVEEWQDMSSIGTYALRLYIKDSDMGSNGKGISKVYARASAYAELIERMQNDLLGDLNATSLETKYPFRLYYDEVYKTSEEIVCDDNAYMSMYFNRRGLNGETVENKVSHFIQLQKLDELYYGEHNKYLTIPFYSYKEGRLVYLPRNVYRLSYGSNGMSAGNSFEEAMVQGLSEIIERYVQKKIIKEKISLHDIPMSYIEKYPEIYKMVQKMKNNKKYRYWLKDCSLGGIYPVAALIILEENTGRYGIKLGCHPDYGIAMERAFTEAAQGQDVFMYSQRSQFDLYNKSVFDDMNIYNTYKTGLGQYPYHIFAQKPTYEFKETMSVKGMSNLEIMKLWCKKISENGYDILVRDVSYLGFNSLHIIIPGISEMFEADDRRYRIYNTRFYVCELLKHPQRINKSNAKYIVSVMEYFMPSVLENTIDTYYDWCKKEEIPCEKYGMGVAYLIAMCYVIMEDYKNATKYMNLIVSQLEKMSLREAENEDIAFYKAIYYYVSGLHIGLDIRELEHYLSVLFDKKLTDKVCNLFVNPIEVIVHQYPEKDECSDVFKPNEVLINIREKMKKIQMVNQINQLDIKNKIEVRIGEEFN